jgi:inorganic pyrophosphatase
VEFASAKFIPGLRIAFRAGGFLTPVRARAGWHISSSNSLTMTKAIEQLAAFVDEEQKLINVIVETGKGSAVKYSYRAEEGLFYAKRLLPPGMVFPFNFGFIPSTLGDDGDPLDILILNDVPLVCGCLAKARLLAVVEAEQTEHSRTFRNDRLVGTLVDEESPPPFLKQTLDERRGAEIQYFFATYNKLGGKEFKVLETAGAEQAKRLVRRGQDKFSEREMASDSTV